MSTSAILPVTASTPIYNLASQSITPAQQAVFDSVLARFKQALSAGDLNTSKVLLDTLTTLSPPIPGSSTVLDVFLSSVGKALAAGSIQDAQQALKTYQASQAAAPITPAPSSGAANSTAATVAASLIQNQLHKQLVQALLSQASDTITAAGASQKQKSSNPIDSLVDLIHTVYGTGNSNTDTALSNTPSYDSLIATLQASLSAGHGTLTPALAYLQVAGNFVNTQA